MTSSVVYTLNPWTILDLAILQEFVARGALMEETTDALGRAIDEVERKVAELRLREGRTSALQNRAA